MRATDFEFRYRALLIGVSYWLGFSAYAIDHKNSVQAMVIWAVGSSSPHRFLATRGLLGLATLLVAFGALVRTWGAAYLRASVVHDAKLHSAVLVADGPYRYVRHPLYFASIVSTLGTGLMASRLGFVIIVGTLTLLYLRLVGREEAQLQEQQGEAYSEFRRHVPRLWPSLAPRVPATGAKPQWGQAFRGETFMWGFALAIGAFAVTFKFVVMAVIMTLALLAFLQQQIVHNRRRRIARQAQTP